MSVDEQRIERYKSAYCYEANDFKQSSNDEGNNEVRLSPDHLIEVQGSNQDERDDEDDSCRHARVVAVELEVAILSTGVRHSGSRWKRFVRMVTSV